ncbi:hypothetical protein HK103_000096 [Boothiomyces macroporosus]|uniref:Uncharacterized protein n=1 Tax=Boothiomyces macroporosus TaxID=261099 RepID=A0AAD5UPB8_9FUNG|nr:hypothetical protein HK103_000096 [Boothiomyces macroporosus]
MNGYLAIVPSIAFPSLNEQDTHEVSVSSGQDPREGRARATFQLERAYLDEQDKRVRWGENFYIKVMLPQVSKPLYLTSTVKSFYTHTWSSRAQQVFFSFNKTHDCLWKFEWPDYNYRMEMEFKVVNPGDEGILTHIQTGNHLCVESDPHLIHRYISLTVRSEYGVEAGVVCHSVKELRIRNEKGHNVFSLSVNA